MPIKPDRNGDKWSPVKAHIALEWLCHPTTLDRYVKDKDCPAPHKTKGWNLRLLREFIIKKYSPHHRMLSAMAISCGEKQAAGKPGDTETLGLDYKERIDRARAIKLETEVAIMKGDLIHIDQIDAFFADSIPKVVGEIRRQLENVLPSIIVGMTAGAIRKVFRKHIDKILANFEGRAKEFKAEVDKKRAEATTTEENQTK